jgi:hypothetical protein
MALTRSVSRDANSVIGKARMPESENGPLKKKAREISRGPETEQARSGQSDHAAAGNAAFAFSTSAVNATGS